MTKEKKEIKINYPVEFEIQRSYLTKIKKAHKNFVYSYDVQHILNCYHFEIKGNNMKVVTTDGNRLLKSEFEINNLSKQDIKFNLSAFMIQNLTVLKAICDYINVSVEKDKITFNDYANGFSVTYKLFSSEMIFPDTEKVIKLYTDRETYSICVNHIFFNELKVLQSNDRNKIIELNCDKKNNAQAILINTGSEDFKQTALLMPIKTQYETKVQA